MTVYQEKNIIPTVNRGGGNVMVWGCIAASGAGQLTVIDSIIHLAPYHSLLNKVVRPSFQKLKWVWKQVF